MLRQAVLTDMESGRARRRSEQTVLREILLSGPVSRNEIADCVNMSAGGVSRIVRSLIDARLAKEIPGERRDGPARPGRSSVPLDIDPEGGQVLGIVIAPSFQTIDLADIKNTTIGSAEIELDSIDDPDLVTRQVAREARRLIGAHLDDRSRLLGGLVTVAGVVDPVRGHVERAPYLGWGAFPLRGRLADFLDLPVAVRPLTVTTALAEVLFGKARGWNNVLTLICGLGLGAAVVLDGRLVQGGRYPSGAIGETRAVGEDGSTTTLDDLASGLGVLRRLFGDDMTPGRAPLPRMAHALREAIERERGGDDPAASAELRRAGRELGRVVVEFCRFVAPELVLVAGPLSMSTGYMAAIREITAEKMAPRPVQVVRSAAADPVGASRACTALAIHECLVKRPLEFSGLDVRPF